MPAPQASWMRRLARERFNHFALRAPRRVGQARCERLIDGICEAICAAWGQWQSQAVLGGVVIEEAVARGGKMLGPLLGPLILARAPGDTPWARRRSEAIAGTLGEVWSAWLNSIWVPGLAAGTMPLSALGQNTVCFDTMALLCRMGLALGRPLKGLDSGMLESVAGAFVTVFWRWHASTMVTERGGYGVLAQRKPMFVLR